MACFLQLVPMILRAYSSVSKLTKHHQQGRERMLKDIKMELHKIRDDFKSYRRQRYNDSEAIQRKI